MKYIIIEDEPQAVKVILSYVTKHFTEFEYSRLTIQHSSLFYILKRFFLTKKGNTNLVLEKACEW